MEIWQREGRKGRRGADASIDHRACMHGPPMTNPLGPSGLKLCGVTLIHTDEGNDGKLIHPQELKDVRIF